MKQLLFLGFILISLTSFGQEKQDLKISTMDFVQVLNENRAEALFYYQQIWAKLRKIANEKAYISSYSLIETEPTLEFPVSFILITTYENAEQFELREEHFQEVMAQKGGLELLNNKKPDEFRKTLFSKERSLHLE